MRTASRPIIVSLTGCKSRATFYLKGQSLDPAVLNRERKKKILFASKVLYKGGYTNEDGAYRSMGDRDRSAHKHRTLEQGYAEEKEHATTCSLSTVKGRYLFATSGMIFPPVVAQPVVFSRAGYRIFNGDGTGTFIATSSENGVVVVADVQGDLSYTVNNNCTGNFTLLSDTTATTEIFIAPNGKEIVAIETGNGRSDDAYSMRRVGPE